MAVRDTDKAILYCPFERPALTRTQLFKKQTASVSKWEMGNAISHSAEHSFTLSCVDLIISLNAKHKFYKFVLFAGDAVSL